MSWIDIQWCTQNAENCLVVADCQEENGNLRESRGHARGAGQWYEWAARHASKVSMATEVDLLDKALTAYRRGGSRFVKKVRIRATALRSEIRARAVLSNTEGKGR